MSFKKRLPTAIILIVVLFVLIEYTPLWANFLVLQALMLACLLEFYGLAQKKKFHPQKTFGVFLAMLISLSFLLPEDFPIPLALFIGLLLTCAYYLLVFNRLEKLPGFMSSIAITFFGPIYLSFTINHLYWMRVEKGTLYLYFLCAIIFLGDTGAQIFGLLFGRHKMTPLASPNKTWEGSLGGILFGILGALLARQFLLKDVDLVMAIVCGALVHAVAQVSDPLESMFKRAVGVKDSSNLLPGHGGFLDRLDSFILASPFFYYVVKYFWK